MKHTIEIPDSHEFVSESNILSQRDETDGYGQDMIVVYLKPKQQKTFDWYVDQYLDASAGSTNDELRNWLDPNDIYVLSDRLKTKRYDLVPWEVKIGLFKFICDENKASWKTAINMANPISNVMSLDFINSLKQTLIVF